MKASGNVTSINVATTRGRTGFGRGDVVKTPDGKGTVLTAVIARDGARHYWVRVDGKEKRYTAEVLPDPSEES